MALYLLWIRRCLLLLSFNTHGINMIINSISIRSNEFNALKMFVTAYKNKSTPPLGGFYCYQSDTGLMVMTANDDSIAVANIPKKISRLTKPVFFPYDGGLKATYSVRITVNKAGKCNMIIETVRGLSRITGETPDGMWDEVWDRIPTTFTNTPGQYTTTQMHNLTLAFTRLASWHVDVHTIQNGDGKYARFMLEGMKNFVIYIKALPKSITPKCNWMGDHKNDYEYSRILQ